MINKVLYDGIYFYIKYNNKEGNKRCIKLLNNKSLRKKILKIEIIEVENEKEIKNGIEITKNMNDLEKIERLLQSKTNSKSSIDTIHKPSSPPTVIAKAKAKPSPSPSPSPFPSTFIPSTSDIPITRETKWYFITDLQNYTNGEVYNYIYFAF